MKPPRARQGNKHTPDGLDPGACADAASLSESAKPGRGAHGFHKRKIGATYDEILGLCPQYDPAKSYPVTCPSYDQLGFRTPLVAIPHLLGKRFLTGPDGRHPHLTLRDANAWTLEDMFDFNASASLDAQLPPTAGLPAQDCSPHP